MRMIISIHDPNTAEVILRCAAQFANCTERNLFGARGERKVKTSLVL